MPGNGNSRDRVRFEDTSGAGSGVQVEGEGPLPVGQVLVAMEQALKAIQLLEGALAPEVGEQVEAMLQGHLPPKPVTPLLPPPLKKNGPTKLPPCGRGTASWRNRLKTGRLGWRRPKPRLWLRKDLGMWRGSWREVPQGGN